MTTGDEERERTSMDREPGTPEEPLLRREESAAAREAGGIGGETPEYEGSEGLPADEEERPVMEAGEGVSEGSETAEGDLRDAAEGA